MTHPRKPERYDYVVYCTDDEVVSYLWNGEPWPSDRVVYVLQAPNRDEAEATATKYFLEESLPTKPLVWKEAPTPKSYNNYDEREDR